MRDYGLIVLIFTAVFGSVEKFTAGEQICPRSTHVQPESPGPTFTSPQIHLDYVRYGHDEEIKCCGRNFDSVDWYRKCLSDNKWVHFRPCNVNCTSKSYPVSQERGQVLSFKSAEDYANSTFRCILNKKGFPSVQRETEIFVVDCDELARGPLSTKQPRDRDILNYGERVTFHCEGYFGCSVGGGESYIGWAVMDPKSPWKQLGSFNSKKFIVQNYNSSTILGANLIVLNIQEKDLGRKYKCIMASSQVRAPFSTYVVQIHKREPPLDKWVVIGICVGAVIGFFIILIIIVFLIKWRWGPQIRFRVRRLLPDGVIGPKTLQDEKYENNAIIYHHEDDVATAMKIKKDLEKQGWIIQTSYDIKPGRMVIRSGLELCEKSAMVIFLYTDNLRNDPQANVIFELIIEARKNKKILIIEMEKVSSKTYVEWAMKVKDENIEMANDDQENLMNNKNELKENGGIDKKTEDMHHGNNGGAKGRRNSSEVKVDVEEAAGGRKAESEENLGILQTPFWKGMPRIKWDCKREGKVLCEIQNKLPKLKHKNEDEKKTKKIKREARHTVSTASNRPLLNPEHRESDSPSIQSPGSDCVFFSDKENLSVENEQQKTVENTKCDEKDSDVVCVDVHNIEKELEKNEISQHTEVPSYDGKMGFPSPQSGDQINQSRMRVIPQGSRSECTGEVGASPASNEISLPSSFGKSSSSGYGSMEPQNFENSNEHSQENGKNNSGQQHAYKFSLTSQSSDEQVSDGGKQMRNSKQLKSQSSGESGYITSPSAETVQNPFSNQNKGIHRGTHIDSSEISLNHPHSH